MELCEFLKKLGELQDEIDLYNLFMTKANFSNLYTPREKDRRDDNYEFEYFLKCLDKRDEFMEKADEAKGNIQIIAHELLLALQDAGLRHISDLDSLTELNKLAKGWT